MIVPYSVYEELLTALKREGLNTRPDILVAASLDPKTLSVLERKKNTIASALKDTGQAMKVLDTIIGAAKTHAEKLSRTDPGIRNIILSYALLIMSNHEINDKLVREAAKTIPAVYRVEIDGKQYALIAPSREELDKTSTDMLKKHVVEVLDAHLEKLVEMVGGNVRIMDTVLETTDFKHPARLGYRIGNTEEVEVFINTVITEMLSRLKFIEAIDIKQGKLLARIKPDKLLALAPPSIQETFRKHGITMRITVHADISYKDAMLRNIYLEIDSPVIGVVRFKRSEEPVDKIHDVVTGLFNSADMFISASAPILIRLIREAERLGYRKTCTTRETGKTYSIVFKKEARLATGRDGEPIVIRAALVLEKNRVLDGVLTSRIEVDNLPRALMDKVVDKIRRLNILDVYTGYNPVLDTSDKLTILLATRKTGDAVALLTTTNTVFKDVETVISSIIKKTQRQPLARENYAALYVVLALGGEAQVLNKMAEHTGITATELGEEIVLYLMKKGIHVSLETLLGDPGRAVDELIRRGVLTFNDALEPVLGEKRLGELIAPFRQMIKQYNIDVLLGIAAAEALKRYREVKNHTFAMELLGNNKLSLPIIIKHISMGVPVEAEILRQRLGDKTVWEQLPDNVKARQLMLMPAEHVVLLGSDTSLPKTPRDHELIIEAICRGTSPSTCTEYLVRSHPEYLGIPRHLKITEHKGEKYLDAGMYRVQVEKIAGGTAVFRIEEKTGGRAKRVKARTIKEALYKATLEDTEATIQA